MKQFLMTFSIAFILFFACSHKKAKLPSNPDFNVENYTSISDKPLTGTICFIGDAGHGTPNQYLVGKALAKDNCQHIWYVGDIIYPDGLTSAEDGLYQTKFALPYKPVIENANFNQFHMALGNHDYKGDHDAWINLAKKYSYLKAPHWYYLEKWPNLCVFVFDSNLYMYPEYEQRANQDAWTKHQLAANKGQCPVSIAILHHPYISSGGHGDAVGALKKFHEESTVGHFDLMVAGHEHLLSDEGTYFGTRLLISGAASESRLRIRHTYQKGYEGNTIGYLKVLLEGTSMTYQFIEVSSKNGEPVSKVADSHKIEAQGLR
ncbi:MAG: metallophosphoesterase [Bacteriovoracaceae bacterium]